MNEASQAELVELRHVDVAREEDPERLFVRGVTWSIREGEWWAICGGPASGKTALLATAAGLSAPSQGVVRIFGHDLAQASESERTAWRREIGFVFEDGGRLLGRLSVAENLALPLRYHANLHADEARGRVEELLGLAGLEALADALPSRLSPAMQRRVALLRALAAPVRLLFLDDPLRGLAPSDARWWMHFLRDLRTAGPLALVVSTYDLAAWRGDADHFALVEDGRFREIARPEGA